MKEITFYCDMCGLCCKNLQNSELYKDLDRGDGQCIFLNNNKCSIYDNRPDKCNVKKMYDLIFYKFYSLTEYYELNYQACQKLKSDNSKER